MISPVYTREVVPLRKVVTESVVEELSALLPARYMIENTKGVVVDVITVMRRRRYGIRNPTVTIDVLDNTITVSLTTIESAKITEWSQYDYAEPDCFERLYEEVLRLLK